MEDHWFDPHPTAEESAKQRVDRNFAELLQEARLAQTGVSILLGFLLTMAFTSRFSSVHGWQLFLYTVALCLATVSMGLLLAPVAVHRVLFRRGLKPHLVRLTHRFMSAGLVALLLSISAAVTLALSLVLRTSVGLALGLVMSTTLLFA